MCFYARTDRSRAKTAAGAITGFKRFKKRGDTLTSPYRKGFTWKIGEYKIEPHFEKTADDYGEVNRGFHCYKTYAEAASRKLKGEKVYMVLIPSGARYHENDEQYCSSEMVIVPAEVSYIPRSKRKK